MVRAFIAVHIDEKIIQKLVDVQKSFPSGEVGLKIVKPENIHLTMKFLGEIPDDKIGAVSHAIEVAASDFPKFSARVQGIGVFPTIRQMRVIWAGVSECREQMIELQRRIDVALQPLGFKPEKDFHPHATIARVKFVKEKDMLVDFIKGKSNEDYGVTEVNNVELIQSQLTPKGPIYSPLATVRLF